MKPLKIALCFLCCLLFMATTAVYLLPMPPARKLSAFDAAVLDFHQRLALYQEMKPPQTVLVGNSHARFMGEDKGLLNLACTAATSREILNIVKQVRPQDTIVLVFSLRDLLGFNKNMGTRNVFTNKFLRVLYLQKMYALRLLRFRAYRGFPEPTTAEILSLKAALCTESPSACRYYPLTIFGLKSLSKESGNLDYLMEAKRLHPKIHFVYQPCVQMQAVPPTKPLASEISAFVKQKQSVERMIASSPLPIYRLPQPENDLFYDIDHVSKQQYRRSFLKIKSLCATTVLL